jgi:DNA repair photolyase
MYSASVEQWNPFVGCNFSCEYCKSSFQLQQKRRKKDCLTCYHYKPHEHPERLNSPLRKTAEGEFIFTCASADIHFCSTEFLKRIAERITNEPDKTFLIQSKDPRTFNRMTFPENVILGTTIETNRDALAKTVGNAPVPSRRYTDLKALAHKRKMVTCEPIMAFDLDVMVDWITQIQPELVWIGYDSKKNNLLEPSREKVEALGAALTAKGIKVKWKTMREARAQVTATEIEKARKRSNRKGTHMPKGKKSIATIEADIAKLQKQLEKRTAEVAEQRKPLDAQIEKLTAEIKKLEDRIAPTTKQIKDKKTELAQAQSELNALLGVTPQAASDGPKQRLTKAEKAEVDTLVKAKVKGGVKEYKAKKEARTEVLAKRGQDDSLASAFGESA